MEAEQAGAAKCRGGPEPLRTPRRPRLRPARSGELLRGNEGWALEGEWHRSQGKAGLPLPATAI